MKSGTNEIHGTGYYFGRNPALNAVVNPITRTRNFVRNHIWGGTAGGPIRKNKLFTFWTYEGWRTKEPRDALRTMPTDLERTGDFSQSPANLPDPNNPDTATAGIYDPCGKNEPPPCNLHEQFPNNQIPVNRESPIAKYLFSVTPQPTNAASGSRNWFHEAYPQIG